LCRQINLSFFLDKIAILGTCHLSGQLSLNESIEQFEVLQLYWELKVTWVSLRLVSGNWLGRLSCVDHLDIVFF
jgi:hypothetical protein